MQIVSTVFMILFIGISMLGTLKIYIGSYLNWFILLLILSIEFISYKNISLNFFIKNLDKKTEILKFFIPSLVGWIIFLLGLIISGILNHDPELYKLIKYFLLFLVFLLLIFFDITPNFLNKCLNFALYMVMIPLLCLIFLGKKDLLIIFGDGRLGWLFAFPGTLWKIGAYVWPITIWKYLNHPNYRNLLPCSLAVFCMALDGSRTAIVWLFVTSVLLAVIFYYLNKSNKINIYKPVYHFLCIILFPYFIIQPIILSWVSKTNILNKNDMVITCYRVVNGDIRTRLDMLKFSLKQAMGKFPWGGGFNSTRVLENGEYSTIHMTYFQLLCDGGILTIIGYLLFILYPLFILFKFITEKNEYFFERFEAMLSSLSIIGLTILIGFFHPISNELNEWGIIFLAISVSMKYIAHNKYALTSSQ